MDNQTPNSPPPVNTPNVANPVTPNMVAVASPALPPVPPVSSGGGGNWKVILILVVLFVTLFLASGGTVYAIAYEKININNPELQKSITQFVQGLPFAPKTAKFLIEKSMIEHEKVTSFDFVLSVAAKSDSLTSVLGVGEGDLEIKGFVDYKDQENVALSLNGSLSSDFNVDLRTKDKFLYIKINKLPLAVLAFAGIRDPNVLKLITDRWIGVDMTPLETEARKVMDQEESKKSTINETVNKELDKLMEEKLLNSITVDRENLDGNNVYKLQFIPTAEVWDYIEQRNNEETLKQYPDAILPKEKLADSFKKFVLTLWIDDSDYLIRKGEIVADVVSQSPASYIPSLGSGMSGISGSGGKTTTSIVGVVGLSGYNEEKTVKVPTGFISPEEFYALIMDAAASESGSLR